MAVSVGASDDTATEGMDYATVGELTLTIEAGATEGTTTFALTPTDDAVDEDDAETLSVTGTTAASGLEVVPTAVTIEDNETESQGTGRGVTVVKLRNLTPQSLAFSIGYSANRRRTPAPNNIGVRARVPPSRRPLTSYKPMTAAIDCPTRSAAASISRSPRWA